MILNQQNSYNKNFCPKAVAEFFENKHHFEIPSYQRGYRWENKQVTDLLDDIYDFSSSKNKETSYYLQPLVVKPVKGKIDTWEVLDGQQRLTTLLLILLYLAKKGAFDSDFAEMIYDITYLNRPNNIDFNCPNATQNLDSFYLAKAQKTIEEWFYFRKGKNAGINNRFVSCLLPNDEDKAVKFIWYVVDDIEDIESIQVFNRLNKGKISLTSSELIKALFIMDRSIVYGDNDNMANQLSMEWNEMERKYQDDKFWYFISDDNEMRQTRIDVLFDFVTKRPQDNEDKDFSYRKFQNLYDYCRDSSIELDELWLTLGIKNMTEAWEYVIKTHDKMVTWYKDNLYYHYIGFLVAVGFSPLEIHNQLEDTKQNWTKEWTKEDTEFELRRLIMSMFKEKDKYLTIESIDGFEYGSDYVLRLLLLFNVETCRKTNSLRFDFNRYKVEQWDIEHISSQNNASIIEREDRMLWLRNVQFILRLETKQIERKTEAQALLDRVSDMIPRYEEAGRIVDAEYKQFSIDVTQYFSADKDAIDNKDSIGNLTLLDCRTNREYQDAPFPYKRYKIIEVDKEGNRFMPICTRNVFLKYYSNSRDESSFIDATRWSKTDKNDYIENIHKMVDPIFNVIKQDTVESYEQ